MLKYILFISIFILPYQHLTAQHLGKLKMKDLFLNQFNYLKIKKKAVQEIG